jgi:hypothetical protein
VKVAQSKRFLEHKNEIMISHHIMNNNNTKSKIATLGALTTILAVATIAGAYALQAQFAAAKKPSADDNFGQCNAAAAKIKDPAAKLAAQNACREKFGKPPINATEAENETD